MLFWRPPSRRRGETTVDQTDIRGSEPHDLIRRGSAGLYERASLSREAGRVG